MKNFIIYFSILCIFYSSPLFSGEKFAPWMQDVSIADENIDLNRKNNDKSVRIFNGPQGVSYFFIRAFQIFISPQDGPNCRFRPTCSAYGKIAVLKHGALLGAFLAGDRIIRCNPYTPPGDDPVPDTIFK